VSHAERAVVRFRKPRAVPKADMTKLLARAFEQASRLSVERQDELAASLLEDLAGKSSPTGTTIQSPQSSEEVADEALKHLVQNGWLTPPTVSSQDPPPRAAAAPFNKLMEELDRDRDDR
jgi:uncharacterized protein YbaP (TraB family)